MKLSSYISHAILPCSLICKQDQLFVPFASLLAFQPVLTNYPPAPDAVPQTATLHRAGALPHGITLPADCQWKWAWRLDQKRRSLPQVTAHPQWLVLNGQREYNNSSLLCYRHLARVTDVDATDTSNPNLNYGLVVDCGSSGSRVFVYCWPRHNGNLHELLNIQQMRDQHRKPVVMKIKPGTVRGKGSLVHLNPWEWLNEV